MNLTLQYIYEKSTKGTHVYSNEQNGSYYIKKELFPAGDPPKELEVTIKAKAQE